MQAMEKERACVAKAAQYRRSLEDAEIPTSVAEELEQEMLLKLLKDNDWMFFIVQKLISHASYMLHALVALKYYFYYFFTSFIFNCMS